MRTNRFLLTALFLLGSTLFGQAKKATPTPTPAPTPAQAQAPSDKKGAKKSAPAAADQCQAMTQAGTQCKRKASPGSKFCWQHAGKKKS